MGETGGRMPVVMGSIQEMGMLIAPESVEGRDLGTDTSEASLLKRSGGRHPINMFPVALAAAPVVLGVITVLRHDVLNIHATTLAVHSNYYTMC